jgi:hypothetical protein
MLDQYGSVLCVACASSMRLATIEPGEAGTSMVMFECRYPPCAKSRVMVLGRPEAQAIRAVVERASETKASGSMMTALVLVDVRGRKKENLRMKGLKVLGARYQISETS